MGETDKRKIERESAKEKCAETGGRRRVMLAVLGVVAAALLSRQLHFALSNEVASTGGFNLTSAACTITRGPAGLEDLVTLSDGVLLVLAFLLSALALLLPFVSILLLFHFYFFLPLFLSCCKHALLPAEDRFSVKSLTASLSFPLSLFPSSSPPKGSELSSVRLWYGPLAGIDSGGDFSTDIWAAVVGPDGQVELNRVVRRQYPAGVRFHPHGLGLWGDRLFVVNHAYAHGGERVDVFQLDRTNGTLELVYVDVVDLSTMAMGTANDVAPVGPAEFYVTQWSPFQQSRTGSAKTRWTDLRDALYYLLIPIFRWTHIFHCRGLGENAVCQRVGPAGIAWNGIQASSDGGKKVYVSDVFDHPRGVHCFDRDLETGKLD